MRHASTDGEGRTVLLREGYGWALGDSGADPADPDRAFEHIIPIYQEAFAGAPWHERSRCPEDCAENREFCDVSPGEYCERGRARPVEEAYPAPVLQESFETMHREGALFAIEYATDPETGEERPVLGVIMCEMDARQLGAVKYPGQEDMQRWLVDRFGDEVFVYRGEVFADQTRRASGNLRNYPQIVEEAVVTFGNPLLVGRTVNVRLLGKLHREYGDQLTIYGPATQPRGSATELRPEVAASIVETVPDDRYLAVIKLN